MEFAYYPGCTLKTKAKNFESTSLALLKELGVNVKELPEWNCCGAVFSLTSDNLMQQLAPVRVLIRAKENGYTKILTLCSMCYHTLKRADNFIKDDEKLEKIRNFMDEENISVSSGEIEVKHILNVIDEIDENTIKSRVKNKAEDLKVAVYYGCLLLRPKEVAIDNSENPVILEKILNVAGINTVYFPFKTECCGAYHVVNNKEIAVHRVKQILENARENQADIIVNSCPLCQYNLDALQSELMSMDSSFQPIPVLYFTQLLALVFGLEAGLIDFELHKINPKPILERKGLL